MKLPFNLVYLSIIENTLFHKKNIILNPQTSGKIQNTPKTSFSKVKLRFCPLLQFIYC